MARVLGAVALVAALVLSAAACGGGGGPRPDLLLVSTRDGYYAIYELNADGGKQRRLSDADIDPEDQEQVFFQIDPAWAPDASRIAFSSRRSGSFDVYTMLADGSDEQQLTSTKDNDVHPAWSPDGKSIAFTRSPGRIYLMNPDGTGAHRLTKDLAEEADPAWSPDGNWIAYTRRTPGSPVRELWLVRPDGSGRHSITNYGQTIYGPTWSPDSKRIAFAGDLDGTIYDIYSVDTQGKSRKRYTQSHSDAFEPAWSPDGQTIAFARDGAIELIEPDGSVTRITDTADNDSSPAWNPVAADDEEEG